MFPSPSEGRETPTLLDSLKGKRESTNHWMATDEVPRRSNSECYMPLSEPFRFHQYEEALRLVLTVVNMLFPLL
jgi:hypothetical protein